MFRWKKENTYLAEPNSIDEQIAVVGDILTKVWSQQAAESATFLRWTSGLHRQPCVQLANTRSFQRGPRRASRSAAHVPD